MSYAIVFLIGGIVGYYLAKWQKSSAKDDIVTEIGTKSAFRKRLDKAIRDAKEERETHQNPKRYDHNSRNN